MGIKLFFLIVCGLIVSLKSRAQNVYIPDSNFKAQLLANFSINGNGDGEIQVSEAENFSGSLYLDYDSIADLTGVEAFTAITFLSCNNNQISFVDVSNNVALEEFYIDDNLLTSLDVSNLTNLYSFSCANNNISSLNINGVTNMAYFWCNNNLLTQLDVSTNTSLLEMNCSDNCIGTLDVSGFLLLEKLVCSYNCLTSLNISGDAELTHVTCSVNNLTSVSVSTNTSLKSFSCVLNELTNLDFSANTLLYSLYCGSNQLNSLIIHNGNNTAINSFSAIYNPFLTCIEVDNITHFNFFANNIDSIASFNTSCITENSMMMDELQSIKIWPNPSNDLLHVDVPKEFDNTNCCIRITNNLGVLLFNDLYTAGKSGSTITIDVSDYNDGVYFFSLDCSERKYFMPFVISK